EKWGNRPLFIDSPKKARAKTEVVRFRKKQPVDEPEVAGSEEAIYDVFLHQPEENNIDDEIKTDNIDTQLDKTDMDNQKGVENTEGVNDKSTPTKTE
ncbi:MAG: hypothetical protein MR288_02425, partial [Firmicutes bacterium]|nr:hypothetical protein [Bacillota bacterium]